MKYIVYITINKLNKHFYIGVHKTLTPYQFDGYLGCGATIKDRHSYMYGKYRIHAAIRKYGVDNFKRLTLAVFDTLKEALALEKQIVNEEFVARKDTYNMTVGGNIPPTIVKIIYQYDMEGNFIKEWPSITEASLYYKCSNVSIGRAVLDNTPCKNFLWSEYKLDNLNIEDFKINANKIKCYLYDKNCNFIQEFISIAECAKFINSTISNLDRAIKTKQLVNKEYYVSSVHYDVFPKQIDRNNLPVYQYDLNGNFIKKWKSAKEARKVFNPNSSIIAAIDQGIVCNGYQWSFEKLEKMPVKKPRAKKVGKYSLKGDLLEVFDSVRKAREVCSGVCKALSGQQKTANNYIWKYIND